MENNRSMFRQIVLIVFGLGLALGAPQFVTFKDGNIGVNFGGYSAQAGLGGLLTGNAAHGGLSASAGTPWGAQAGAGLGGSVNGNAAGTAYAGAKLNDQIGASSIIGGSTGATQSGVIGAEAHSNGNTGFKTVSTSAVTVEQPHTSTSSQTATKHVLIAKDYSIQKIKPPKKYTPDTNVPLTVEHKTNVLSKAPPVTNEVTTADVPASTVNAVSDNYTPANGVATQKENVFVNHLHRKHHLRPAVRRRLRFQKEYTTYALPQEQHNEENANTDTAQDKHVLKSFNHGLTPTTYTSAPAPQVPLNIQHVTKSVQVNPGLLTSIFNIPIGILSSIRDNLQPIEVQKEVTYSKVV